MAPDQLALLRALVRRKLAAILQHLDTYPLPPGETVPVRLGGDGVDLELVIASRGLTDGPTNGRADGRSMVGPSVVKLSALDRKILGHLTEDGITMDRLANLCDHDNSPYFRSRVRKLRDAGRVWNIAGRWGLEKTPTP